MIKPEDLQSYRRIGTRSEAREAFDRVAARAQRSLQIFDDRGEFWGLDRKTFADAALALLGRHADAHVTIVVHDPAFIERRCARLVELLRRHSPRLQVLQTEPAVRHYPRGLVIADGAVVLRRPHFDQPRVFVDFDETAVTAATALFAELLDGAQTAITATVTGL